MHTGTRINATTQRRPDAPSSRLIIGLAAAAILSACGGGGGDEAVSQGLSAQQQKEAAALERAHQLNAAAMGKVKAERATRSGQSN